jgi:hypothetical protein
MTHDELSIEVNRRLQVALYNGDIPAIHALKAVVALHQPYQHEVVSYVFCKGCTIDLDLAPPYPCETIQAIEKELG